MAFEVGEAAPPQLAVRGQPPLDLGEAGGTVLRDTPVGESPCHLVLAAEDRP